MTTPAPPPPVASGDPLFHVGDSTAVVANGVAVVYPVLAASAIPWTVVNGAQGSATAEAWVSSLWASQSPGTLPHRAVHVGLGVNDWFIGRTPAQFGADLTTLVGLIRASTPGVPVFVSSPSDHGTAPAGALELFRDQVDAVTANPGLVDVCPGLDLLADYPWGPSTFFDDAHYNQATADDIGRRLGAVLELGCSDP